MCIAYISIGQPDWPLLIAANRDEFHYRSAAKLGPWHDKPNIIAGRDLLAGGTWLAWSQANRYGLLTNYREPNASTNITNSSEPNTGQLPSRGNLVVDFLLSDLTVEDYISKLLANIDKWAGFNLVLGDLDECWYLTNRNLNDELNLDDYAKAMLGTKPSCIALKLKTGSYVISNHLIDTPWPKCVRLKDQLDAIEPSLWLKSPELIFSKLYDVKKADIHNLPNTGVSKELELLLSSTFIISENYGTRCSSLIAINKSKQGLISELSFNPKGEITERHDWPIIQQ